MKWREVAQTGSQSEFVAIIVASLPLVYRVGRILKELQPEIRQWLQAQAQRAQADTEIVGQLTTLVEDFKGLSDELKARDEREAQHWEAQDRALIELLRRTTTEDGDGRETDP